MLLAGKHTSRYDKFSDDDLNQLSSLIDWAHENNMEFHITELNLWVKEENFDKNEVKNWQADTYSKFMNLLFQKNKWSGSNQSLGAFG